MAPEASCVLVGLGSTDLHWAPSLPLLSPFSLNNRKYLSHDIQTISPCPCVLEERQSAGTWEKKLLQSGDSLGTMLDFAPRGVSIRPGLGLSGAVVL